MRVPLSWITDYVDTDASPKEAAHLLTMSGTNIESVNGEVLEAEITPNRGDCLSIVGLAREVSAVRGLPLNVPAPRIVESGAPASDSVAVEIQAPDLCPRYSARLLRNVKNGPSPQWMQDRLLACGLRPINVIVDVTNYVMLEYGQPLHAFDFERIAGGKIVVRRANEGERFVTLDGQQRTLDASILMICDAERSVAVAGVMGGENSEVSEKTSTVLLESAHFSPVAVRAAAKRLGMSTDSSYRFERGVDPTGTVRAADRAAQLLQELAGAEVAPGVVDAYPRPIEPRTIRYRPSRGSRLIGPEIPPDEQRRFLEALGLDVNVEGDSAFVVTAPTFRPDLEQEDDIAEEVGRIYGYEKIPYTQPGGGFFGKLSPTQELANVIRGLLRGSGLQEVLTHSLHDPALLARFSETVPARVRNPLSEEFAALRTSLLPMLVGVADRNTRLGRHDIQIFEVGTVFLPAEGREGVEEPLRVSGLLCGNFVEGRWKPNPVTFEADFFTAKGVVETLLDGLLISGVRYEAATSPGLHPGRTAQVWIHNRDAGVIGQIHPSLQAELELPGPTFVFELDFDALRQERGVPKAMSLPRFPGVSRDLAMLVPKQAAAGRVREVILHSGGPYLEDVTVFDVYEGKGIPERQKSLAYSLRFRSPERTLTDSEVDEAVRDIRTALSEEVGATER